MYLGVSAAGSRNSHSGDEQESSQLPYSIMIDTTLMKRELVKWRELTKSSISSGPSRTSTAICRLRSWRRYRSRADPAVSPARRGGFLSAFPFDAAGESAGGGVPRHVVSSARRRHAAGAIERAVSRNAGARAFDRRVVVPGSMRWRAGDRHQRSGVCQREHGADRRAGAGGAGRHRNAAECTWSRFRCRVWIRISTGRAMGRCGR